MITTDQNCQLFCGDCLEVMKQMPDKSVDMILCDLPYGTTACKWDAVIPFDKLWKQYNRIIKDYGAILLFASEPFASNLRLSNLKMYRYDWYWDKGTGGNFMLGKSQPSRHVENIVVFCKKKPKYFPQLVDNIRDRRNQKPNRSKVNIFDNNLQLYVSSKNKPITKKYPNNIIRISSQSGECNNTRRVHPTQKPVALCEYLIKTHTYQGEIVLDNCMGSGSVGVACRNLDRKFIGIELDEEYFKIAENRIKGGLL